MQKNSSRFYHQLSVGSPVVQHRATSAKEMEAEDESELMQETQELILVNEGYVKTMEKKEEEEEHVGDPIQHISDCQKCRALQYSE